MKHKSPAIVSAATNSGEATKACVFGLPSFLFAKFRLNDVTIEFGRSGFSVSLNTKEPSTSICTTETTSVSLLEAMSYGCIPIVSNIPANTEWIEDKINGLYYERSKIPEFLCNAFRINREIIRERAIWSNNIKKFVKIILGE